MQQWQNEPAAKASYNLTMACRSLLNRILQAAADNRLIPFNPASKVRPPKRSVDPKVIFGRVRRVESSLGPAGTRHQAES